MSSNTDVLFQKVTLFIEGVEVPYSAISISQAIGNVPSASLELPPSPGLMDIVRYYQPKVHIFYEDPVLGKDRLLFWGHIIGNSYSASVQSASINFQCVHKSDLLNHVTLDFSGYPSGSYTNWSPNDSMFKPNSFGSTHSMVLALRGIDGVRTESNTENAISISNPNVLNVDHALLDPKFSSVKERWVGMPSAMMNMWNQLKSSAYHLSQYNTILVAMYIPLIEDGLKFFDRVSGHNLIEDAVNAGKQSICDDTGNKTDASKPVMIPPAYRLHSMTATQASLSVEAIQGMLEFTGNKTGFFRLFHEFFMSSEYEVVTLASPASVPKDPKKTSVQNDDDLMAIETVIKPQLPFYYSPVCNVVLPNMYSSVQVSQNEANIPSRVSLVHSAVPGQEAQVGLHYRGPHSIRESVLTGLMIKGLYKPIETPDPKVINGVKFAPATPAEANATVVDTPSNGILPSLHESTGASYNIPGKYELGGGFKPKQVIAPSWLAYLVKRCNESIASGTVKTEEHPDEDSDWGKITKDLHDGWMFMHGRKNGKADPAKELLDPNFRGSGVAAFQRILFAAADYDYTKEVLSSKAGSISGIFNPYIIPGYPMDIVAKSPNLPSFHALCASVTHSITADSINTSVAFVSAATYSELSNYELMPSHPWLQTSLQLYNINRDSSGSVTSVMSTILNNPKAKAKADEFYRSVLGVGSAAPSDLINFQTMEVYTQKRVNGVLAPGTKSATYSDNGGSDSDDTTGIGNLKLIHRAVETRESIEKTFNYKFIDLVKENYTNESLNYLDPRLNPDVDEGVPLELGASLFLDYPETIDFLKSNNIQVI